MCFMTDDISIKMSEFPEKSFLGHLPLGHCRFEVVNLLRST